MRKASLKQILQATSRHFCCRMEKEGGKKTKMCQQACQCGLQAGWEAGSTWQMPLGRIKPSPHQATPRGLKRCSTWQEVGRRLEYQRRRPRENQTWNIDQSHPHWVQNRGKESEMYHPPFTSPPPKESADGDRKRVKWCLAGLQLVLDPTSIFRSVNYLDYLDLRKEKMGDDMCLIYFLFGTQDVNSTVWSLANLMVFLRVRSLLTK